MGVWRVGNLGFGGRLGDEAVKWGRGCGSRGRFEGSYDKVLIDVGKGRMCNAKHARGEICLVAEYA